MAKDTINLPLMGRAASVRPESIDPAERTVEIVWTTGAMVQRVRWEGWDVVEYDEELVVEDEAVRLERLNQGAPFLDSHHGYTLSSVLGSIVPGTARIEGGMGYATIQLTEAEDVKSHVDKILDGSVRHVSVGYKVHRYEKIEVDGQRELWRATDWEPYEISAVAMPADPGAHFRSDQSDGGPVLTSCVLSRQNPNAATAAIIEEPIMGKETTEAGGVEDTTTRSAPANQTAGGGTDAPATPSGTETRAVAANDAPNRETALAEAVDAENARVTEILGLCGRHGVTDEVRAELIKPGVSVDAARTRILDDQAAANPADRVAVPAQARDDGATERGYADAMTNALQHRHNPGTVALSDDARQFRGMSLMDLARDCLSRRNVTVRGMSKMEVAREAFQMRSVGGHSTSDFPTILANVAGKTLRAAYDSTPRTFATWARRVTITDFKEVSRVQLGGAPDLVKKLESGEFKRGTMGESKEAYSLMTYGRIVALTRETIINDDLDAFTRVPAAFGAAAADLESDLVYGLLLDNPALSDGEDLFSSAHGNVGTAAVINEQSLAKAMRAFGSQKGIEKRLISVLPRYILVPPGQRVLEARKQVTSTTPANAEDVNAFAGELEVVQEPRLIPATGQDPWFLAAEASRVDTVEYAYLEGQEGVFVETRNGFEMDGMEIKARHDFAAAAIDHRGLYKNAGAAAG